MPSLPTPLSRDGGDYRQIQAYSMRTLELRNARVPFFIKPILRNIASQVDKSFLNAAFEGHYSFLEKELESSPGGGPFLAGKQLSGAVSHGYLLWEISSPIHYYFASLPYACDLVWCSR